MSEVPDSPTRLAVEMEKAMGPLDSPTKLALELQAALDPTEDELAYKFSEKENRFLCEKLILKVNMWSFNPLHKLNRHYEKHGKMANRSSKTKLKLLMKGYKKYKNDPRVVISDEEIAKNNKEYLEFRKGQNVRYLKHVEDEFKKYSNTSINSNSDDDITVIETDIVEPPPYDVDKQRSYVEEFFGVLDEFGMRPGFSSQSQSQDQNQNNSLRDSMELLQKEAIENIESIPLVNSNTADSMMKSVDTEKGSEIEENLEIFTQSSESYQSFNKRIPLTSTQSQSQSQGK